MICRLSIAIRTSRMAAIANALDASGQPGQMHFYSGYMPDAGGAITDQVRLGTVTLSRPCGTAADGTLVFAAIAGDYSADADGIATWARFEDGAGEWVMDGDVGTAASSAMVRLDNTQIWAGGIITVTSGALSDGNA